MTTLVGIGVTMAWAGPVTVTTADGVSLSAEAWGTGGRAVLLVPDEAGSRAEWSATAPRMANAGLQVLAIDLRSKAHPPAEADWPKATADVDAGVAWLAAHGATEIHVVGARMGANLALAAAAANPKVGDLVLLSPGLAVHGVRVSTTMPTYGDRALLVVTSDEDPMSVKAATWLDGQATGAHRVEIRPGAGVGTAMFNKVPDLESTIVGWINGAYAQKEAGATLAGEVKTGAPGQIETTGTRLEDRQR